MEEQNKNQSDSEWTKAEPKQENADNGFTKAPIPQTVPEPPKKKKGGCLKTFIVIIILFALIGKACGSDDAEDATDTSTDVTQTQESTANEQEEQPKEEKPKEVKTEFKTGKIYSGHKCKLSVSSGDNSSFSIEIANKSKKDYSFDIHSMAINGIMTNCNIYTGSTSVPSGKKGIMSIDFDSEWLTGIENVEYIDFIIWAYDDAKSYKDFETDIIRVKTNKFQKTNKFKAGKGSKKQDGLVVYKEKLDTEEFVFSVINKNKYFVEFDFNNSSINGWAFEDDYLFDAKSVCVYPNCKTTIKIDLLDFTTTSKIDSIKNIEFSLGVRQKGDYFKEKETKKIKFK